MKHRTLTSAGRWALSVFSILVLGFCIANAVAMAVTGSPMAGTPDPATAKATKTGAVSKRI